MSIVSNSNLMNHLSTARASTKLVAKNTIVDTFDDDANKEGHRAVQAATAGFFCSSFTKT